ncbi:lysozyme [Paraburkholderia aspalathi]|uniref:lysozyme n=1 Tax=Paraburkholderia aspalathi TaxID=1324617 RepID=UPI0038B9C015
MVALLRFAGPYVLAVLIGAIAGALIGARVSALTGARQLAQEQAAHARDSARYAQTMKALTDAALAAQRQAQAEHLAAARQIETLNAQLTRESEAHETENRQYRAALADGTERVRVAVARCTGGGHRVPDAAGAARVDDGAPAWAELDRAVAQRVFAVAGDDQHEIDKLKALQGYVCAVRPQTPGCAAGQVP